MLDCSMQMEMNAATSHKLKVDSAQSSTLVEMNLSSSFIRLIGAVDYDEQKPHTAQPNDMKWRNCFVPLKDAGMQLAVYITIKAARALAGKTIAFFM